MENEAQEKTKVRIYIDQFMIVGEIAALADVPLNDFLADAPAFIAVTHATVQSLEDRRRFTAENLNIHKDKIMMILSDAMVKPDYAARRRWPL
jgi:hypothetical protein